MSVLYQHLTFFCQFWWMWNEVILRYFPFTYTEGESAPLSTSPLSLWAQTLSSFRRRLSLFFFFSLVQPWSLSLFSLRGCEQKAIKPLQSLVRDRYRNERWRDRKDAWAATHFTLKWGNEWLSEWGKEGKKDGHGGVLAGKEKRKSMWFIRWGERECETCKCLIVGACLKITECSDEKWE